MRFGVNYTPRVGWFHSWLDYDPAHTRRDFSTIASLGVDHVRIFPLWEIVQPNRTLIRQKALADIADVVDAAAEFGLDVNVDALQGHLSSFDFLPSWLVTWHDRNMFIDETVIGGIEAYIRALGNVLHGRENVMGLTLGNEVNQFASRPHPHPHPVDAAGVDRWLERLLAAARESAPGLITHAAYDAAWYDERQPFLPRHAAEHGDATIIHSWVFNGAAQRHGSLGVGSVRHAEYFAQLAAAWHADADRPVWLQEVGVPLNVVERHDATEFLTQTVRNVAGVAGLSGITWWSSHDVNRDLADFPELEYDLGLIDSSGAVKPTGTRFAELISEMRAEPSPAPVASALVLDDAGEFRAAAAPGGRFFEAWMAEAERQGRGPQVVLASRLADRDLQASRGIVHVAAPSPVAAPVNADAGAEVRHPADMSENTTSSDTAITSDAVR